MSRSDTHRVADMLMAAAEIGDITARGRAAFNTDVTLRRAVDPMAKIRDRLSHHYHRIDPAQLWVVAETDIPALADQLRRIHGS